MTVTVRPSHLRTDLLVTENFLPERLFSVLADPQYEFEPIKGRADRPADEVYPRQAVRDADKLIKNALLEFYGIKEEIYSDYVAASRMTAGMNHVRHADAVKPNGEPNHTPWRLVTAMLYITTQGDKPEEGKEAQDQVEGYEDYVRHGEFLGGDLRFPFLNRTINPKANMLVGFRCDALHTHEVPPVEVGLRRAIAVWYTTDPRRERRY